MLPRCSSESIRFQSVAGPSALDGIVQSVVTGSIAYNSVDNPINPRTGRSLSYSAQFTGGFLGGNVDTIQNTLWTSEYFHPVHKKRNVIGVHGTFAYITPFGNASVDCTKGLPSGTMVNPNTCECPVGVNKCSVAGRVSLRSRVSIWVENRTCAASTFALISPVTFIPTPSNATISVPGERPLYSSSANLQRHHPRRRLNGLGKP